MAGMVQEKKMLYEEGCLDVDVMKVIGEVPFNTELENLDFTLS